MRGRTHIAIVSAIKSPVWRVLAFQDVMARYRRSTIGAFWHTATTSAFVLSVGSLYGGFFGEQTAAYMLYLGTGFILWQFVQSAVNESATGFIVGRDMLLNTRVSPLSLVFRIVARNAFILAHNAPVYLVLAFYANPDWRIAPLALPGLVALTANVTWISMIVALGGARFRDVPPIVGASTQLLFLLTPILWMSGAVSGARGVFAHFNPLAHILSAAREPLIGAPIPITSLMLSGALAILGICVATAVYHRTMRRIPYWL